MKHAAEPEVLGGVGIFERNCAYCGARFRVRSIASVDEIRAQPYECPSCGKTYEMLAGEPPHVRLLQGLTDGKDDRYQETIF